jgi:hypothetical protein
MDMANISVIPQIARASRNLQGIIHWNQNHRCLSAQRNINPPLSLHILREDFGINNIPLFVFVCCSSDTFCRQSPSSEKG